MSTLTSKDFSRLHKQWDRRYTVMEFGVYIYQINLSNLSELNTKTIDYNNPVVNNSSIASSTINSGEFVNLTLKASGGSGSYTYSFNVRKQGSTDILMSRTNLTSTNYNFTISSSY